MNCLKAKVLTKAPGKVLLFVKVIMAMTLMIISGKTASAQITPAFSHTRWGKTITFTDHTVNHSAYYTVKTMFYGDGASDTVFTKDSTKIHTYAHYGTYKVTLQIYSTAFSSTFDTTEYVTLDSCTGGDFTIENLTKYSISLTTTDTSGKTGSIYTFNTGDGDTTQGPRSSHTYSTDGNYTVCLTVRNPNTGCNVTNCKHFIIANGIMSGLEYINNNTGDDFQVYPNPVHDKLRFNCSSTQTIPVTYTVSDMLGHTYITNKLTIGDHMNQQYIDVEHLPTGIYILKAILPMKEVQSRFVKVP